MDGAGTSDKVSKSKSNRIWMGEEAAKSLESSMAGGGNDNLQQPGPEVEKVEPEPTREMLMAEVGQLRQENGKLKRALKLVKGVLKTEDEWAWKVREYKSNLKELAAVQKEEEELKPVVQELMRGVDQLGKLTRGKENEVQVLKRKVIHIKLRLLEWHLMEPHHLAEGQRDGGANIFAVAVGAKALPEEVWRMILGNVMDPNDLWNCTNACQLFEDILHPWKTGWMLEQSLPHLYQFLPGNKLLEARSVCRGWRTGVDRFLEGHPSLQPIAHHERDPRIIDFVCPLKEKGICGRNELSIVLGQEDLAILEDPYFRDMAGQNPFIGRYLSLTLLKPMMPKHKENVGKQQWWDKLFHFLEAFGKEVWYFNLFFPCPWEMEPREWDTTILRRFLHPLLFQYLPNLRRLTYPRMVAQPLHRFNYFTFGPDYNIPVNPKLETIECAHDLENLFLFQRHSMQLRKLRLPVNLWSLVRHLEWPNLNELHVMCPTGGILHLGSLLRVRMPGLMKLTLDISLEYGLKTLMVVINKLCSTTRLASLRLIGPLPGKPTQRFEMESYPRAPSSLTSLEIVDPNNRQPPPYDFLMHCFPFLESLHVIYRKRTGGGMLDSKVDITLKSKSDWTNLQRIQFSKADEFIQVNQFLLDGEMYRSNIWEMMPLLKVFSFQWDVFTREGFEAYLNSKARIAAEGKN